MPEVRGKRIVEYVHDLAIYLGSNEFKTQLKSWYPDLDIYTERLVVSGVSAGGFLAACLCFQGALRISVLYMQYPMLDAYRRQPAQLYRGQKMDRQNALAAFVTCIRRYGQEPTKNNPPKGMEMCHAMSSFTIKVYIDNSKELVTISLWDLIFGHQNVNEYLGVPLTLEDEETSFTAEEVYSELKEEDVQKMTDHMDISFEEDDTGTRQLRYKKDKFDSGRPSQHPGVVVIAHGKGDVHCPISGSERFKKAIQDVYPKSDVELFSIAGKAHGFDTEEDSEMPGEVLNRVKTGCESGRCGSSETME
jgi:acetyl esterase/lipase